MWFRNKILLIIFLFTSVLFSQNIVVQEYSKDNFLESNEILKIFQDSRQYLWVSTRTGIYIQNMDKFQIINYFKDNNFNQARDIIEDINHNMWFASYGDGVLYFDGTNIKLFNTSKGLLSDRNLKLLEDNLHIYVGGTNGISIINKKTFKIKTATFKHPKGGVLEVNNIMKIGDSIYATTIYNGIFILDKNQLKPFKNINNIVTAYVYKQDVVLTSNNGILVFTQENFKKNLSPSKHINLPIIWDYTLVSNNTYWMLTSDLVNSKGLLYEYDDTKDANTRILKDIDLKLEYPRGIVFDKSNNNVFISSNDSGLKRFLLNMPHDFHSLENQSVSNIYTIGNLDYITTKNEFYIRNEKKTIVKVSKNEFYNYFQNNKHKYKSYYTSHPEFFKINYNQEIDNIKFYHLKFHKNTFWIGSNIGLFKLDKKGNILKMYPLHAYNFEFSGDLLIDSHPFSGIKIFKNLDQLDYTYYNHSLPAIPSYVISMDKIDDKVFFASSIYGLYKYDKGKFYSYFQSGVFKEAKLKVLKSLPNNRLILATEMGDVYIINLSQNRFKIERKISKEAINSDNVLLLNEIDGKVIIGTYNALVIVDGNQFYFFDKSQGFKFKKMKASSISSNKLLIGVDYGYFSFNIDQIVNTKAKKYNVIINNLKINGQELPHTDFKWFNLQKQTLTFPSTSNNIIVDFSIVNPKYPDKFKYRYRLNNKENWSEFFDENSIQFNALKNGIYSIDLEVTDLNGNRAYVFHLLDVKINPPFYMHPLFIFGVILVIFVILGIFYRQKIQNIKLINDLNIKKINSDNEANRKQITLEKKVTEIKLLALQSQMNPHFIFNILNSIQYYIIDNDVNNALESLNQFARLIRKMLELSSKNEITLKEKIDFLELYVKIENFRYKIPVNFSVEVDPDIDVYKTTIPPMLLQPLVENCFVHAFSPSMAEKEIKISFKMIEEFLIITVIDNGSGIELSDNNTKFYESKGLGIIRERLKLFNDSDEDFLIYTSNSNGTEASLRLKIPINK